MEQQIDKAILLSLLSEAFQVTAMAALWTGNLPTSDKTDIALTKYYFKWIDVAKLAVENLADNTPEESKKILADDLVRLISVPLQGMIDAVSVYATQVGIILPPINKQEIPKEIFSYKAWAMDYISKSMNTIKEVGAKK